MKNFTFTVKGDFTSPTFTRAAGYLSADGSEMTNLWVFDFVDGICVQQVAQTAQDEDWGRPSMRLGYGSHHVYFVASRGDAPVVDETAHMVTWGTPRDTFWKDYEVDVVSTSNGNRAVTLDRVATKLRLAVDDEVPTGAAQVVVTPEQWYYGLNYTTGQPASVQRKDRAVNVPAAYVGTEGQLAVTIFGLSGAEEWQTDVTVAAKDADGGVLGQVQIAGAPFKANRATEYHGRLFGGSVIETGLNGEWGESYTGEW